MTVSCVAISRSYPRHLVKFCEEKKKKNILPPFFLLLLLKRCIFSFAFGNCFSYLPGSLPIYPYSSRFTKMTFVWDKNPQKHSALSQIDGFFGYFCPPTIRLFVNPELSDASQSEYPASLSYPMATFSANNFGHFGFYLMLNPVGPESIHIHFCYAVVWIVIVWLGKKIWVFGSWSLTEKCGLNAAN